MSSAELTRNQIARILDWLAGEPADNCLDDLKELVLIVEALPGIAEEGAAVQLLPILDARVLDVSGRLKPALLTSALPLPQPLHSAATNLVRVLLELVALYRRATARPIRGEGGEDTSVFASRAMKLVSEAYLLCCMAGIETRAGLWQNAYFLFDLASRSAGEGPQADPRSCAIARFQRIVAVSALQPEGLTAREVAWLFDYLEGVPAAVELSTQSMYPDNTVFWMDTGSDGGPVAQVRREPPSGKNLLYFRVLALSKRVAEQMDWLERRMADADVVGLERDVGLLDPEVSGVPLGLLPVEVLPLLRRMRECWATPPNREHVRRRQSYGVEVCQGLKAIWKMCRGEDSSVVEWRVFNESPGGYAIISIEGVGGVLSAGMALALRRNPDLPWSICIVRWIRNDNPDEVELGLQVVSQACAAASIGFRSSEARATVPALILPPMLPARRNQAILASAGTYTSRRFVLVREGAHRIYVVQGRVLSLDMQTANVEIFQYEPDPYPI